MATSDINPAKVIHETPMIELQHSDRVSETEEQFELYRISWRTVLAIIVLSLTWSSTTYAVAGVNTAISYMVSSFPGQEANASWIANSVLFCIVTVPVISGAISDRYGKKWLMVIGGIIGACGSIVSGRASSINMIIGGQALSGVGASAALVCVAASMEIVPTRYRPVSFACMAILNSAFGAVGGPLICT
jgi:MFS family permease